MKKFETIMGVILIIFFLGAFLFVSLTNARTIEYTQAVPSVATGGGVTTADVVLLKSIFDNDLASITSITSSNAADFPAVDNYVIANKTLTVQGLAAADTRNLTIVYRYARFTGGWSGLDLFFLILPVLIIVMVVWYVVDGLRHGRR